MSRKMKILTIVATVIFVLASMTMIQLKEGRILAAGKKAPEKITIGWTPPDITGVFKTATDYFEKSAKDASGHGIEVEVISQSPATHVAFADQVAIIEDYVERDVDVIAISPIEVEVIKPALKKANEKGIPVIIVNLLEPIAGVEVASYIGFDNTDAGRISAYSLLDYFGAPREEKPKMDFFFCVEYNLADYYSNIPTTTKIYSRFSPQEYTI